MVRDTRYESSGTAGNAVSPGLCLVVAQLPATFGGDTSVRVDLLEHLVDVDAVGFLPLALLLLVALGDGLLGLAGLLGGFTGGFGWHICA